MADEHALLLAMGTHSPYVHQLFYHLFKDDPLVHYAAHKEMRASVCQKCGDPGFKELLVHCKKCKISAEHRYCLDKFPKPEERVHWFCEQCEPSSTFASLGKLVVCNARSNDDLKCSDQQKDFSDIPRHQDKRQATSYNGGTVSKVPNRRDKSRMSSSCNKVVPLHKMQNDGTSGSEHKKFQNDVKIHPCTSPKKDGGRKLKRRRRLLLQEDPTDHELLSDNVDRNFNNKPIELPPATVFALPPPHIISCDEIVQEKVHDNQPNMQCNQAPSDQHLYSVAQPIIDPVWRGHIYFGDEKYGPWTAHASTIACGRVFTAAKLLPAVLQMEKLPRLLFCPNSFKNASPTDDKIGLYFFPGGTKVDRVLDQFLDDVIHKDFLFRFMFDETELLVFSSTILHQNHQKFRGKYYLWGAFRGRQAAVSSSYANCHSRPTEPGVDSRGMKVSYEHAGEKEEGEGRDNDSSELSNFTLSPLSVLSHPPRSNELREDPPRSEDTSKLAGDRGGVEANDKEEQEDYELEEGEIYEGHVEREKGDDPEEYVEGEDGDSPEDSDKDCLQFLPLASEDMGIVSKYGSGNGLNLDLELSRRKVDGNDPRDLAVLNSLL